MASLFFDYVYTSSAAQETVVTVSGEEQSGVSGAVADETVVVNVSKAKIDALMTVGAQSASGVGYPQVSLDWNGLAAELDPKWADLLGVTGTPTTFNDDSSPPVAISTLQTVFATKGFTFTAPDSLLLTIPPEAISKVGVTGTIILTPSVSVSYMRGENSILGTLDTAPSTDVLDDDKHKAIRGLFLQALAAGRYDQSGSTAASDANLPATASPGFDFSVDDTITFYTRFTLTKTRRYVPDPEDQLDGVGAGNAPKFTINGTDIVIDDVDDTLTSDPKTWTVEWVLKVVA
jgi:hypothetical protein